MKELESESSGGMFDIFGSGASYSEEDTSYPKLESSGSSGMMGGGGGLSSYSGNDVNLLPAIKIIDLSKSGTNNSDYIKEISVSDLRTLISANFSGMTKLTTLSLPAGANLKTLNLTGDTELSALNLTNTYGFLFPEGFTTLTGLISFDMMNREDLASIDVSNFTKLKELDLTNCVLENLDVTRNLALETLNIAENEISVLDLSQHKNLKKLNARLNMLLKIDLSNNLGLYQDSHAKAELSPQICPMDTERSKKFNFIEDLGYTHTDIANILETSIKGDGLKPVSTDLPNGDVKFASAPFEITYNYASGLYEGSDPLYLNIRLQWAFDSDEVSEDVQPGAPDDEVSPDVPPVPDDEVSPDIPPVPDDEVSPDIPPVPDDEVSPDVPPVPDDEVSSDDEVPYERVRGSSGGGCNANFGLTAFVLLAVIFSKKIKS